MPTTRRPYPPEFRRQMVELVRAGRGPDELAREFEPSGQSIRNWVRQVAREAGAGDGLSADERQELRRLRRSIPLFRFPVTHLFGALEAGLRLVMSSKLLEGKAAVVPGVGDLPGER